MGIILKENNLVHTKRRHNKFIGSSCFTFDKVNNSIVKKEKPKKVALPPIPIEMENNTEDIYRELEQFYSGNNNPRFNKFLSTNTNVEQAIEKRAKKKLYKLNKKKVREKCTAMFGLKASRKFLAFITISFPMGFPDRNALRCLNTALTELRKRYKLKTYIRVSEYQKNGTIHFHILTNNYMYVRMVNRLFAKAIRHEIKKDKLQVNFDFDKYNGVDIKRVDNNKRALASYLTKYISKNTIEHEKIPFHCSRDVSQLFTAETFSNENCADFRFIKRDLKHVVTTVVDNEYATVEYLNVVQPNGKYFVPPDKWYWFLNYVNEQIYNNCHSKLKFNVLPLG